jgi:hypothetical protein
MDGGGLDVEGRFCVDWDGMRKGVRKYEEGICRSVAEMNE